MSRLTTDSSAFLSTPTTGRSRRRRRLALSAVVLLPLATGCLTDADKFNQKAAELICSYNDQDPDRPILSDKLASDQDDSDLFVELLPYGGSNCEDHVLDDLEECPDLCEYSVVNARRCLTRLRRADRTGDYNEGWLAPCLSVYECPEDVDAGACVISDGCSVSGGRRMPTASWLALLLAVVTLRRGRSPEIVRPECHGSRPRPGATQSRIGIRPRQE